MTNLEAAVILLIAFFALLGIHAWADVRKYEADQRQTIFHRGRPETSDDE